MTSSDALRSDFLKILFNNMHIKRKLIVNSIRLIPFKVGQADPLSKT